MKFVRFNMSDVSKMSENSMDDNCDKLAQYMTELEMSRSIFRPGSSEHKKNPASETQGSKASDHTGKVRKFILVGHVLGCWIVRHLVWKYQNETIVVNTIATVFVDDDSMQSRQIDQCRYLRNARRIFSLKLKSDDNINTVATTLHLINGEFREALRTLKDSASTTIKTWSCKVWLSENSQEQSEQVSSPWQMVLTPPKLTPRSQEKNSDGGSKLYGGDLDASRRIQKLQIAFNDLKGKSMISSKKPEIAVTIQTRKMTY